MSTEVPFAPPPPNMIYGTPGNDNLTGTDGADRFDLSQGGDDTANGLGGSDVFYMGGALTANDHLIGGDPATDYAENTVELDGDYSAGLVLAAGTFTDIDTLQLDGGHSYNIITNDVIPANSQLTYSFLVDATTLTSTDSLTFDARGETDHSFVLESTAGSAQIYGGAGDDELSVAITGTGHYAISGGSGDDGIGIGAGLKDDGSVVINGGAGRDILAITGDYSSGLTLDSSWLKGVEGLDVYGVSEGGGPYVFTAAADFNTAGHTFSVTVLNFNSYNEGGSNDFSFDGSAATGNFTFQGNAGNDVFKGGAGSDYVMPGYSTLPNPEPNTDTFDGGGGVNTLNLQDTQTTGGVTFSLAISTAQTAGNGTITATNFQNLEGTASADTLTGNNSANWLEGGGGTDTLIGSGGDDFLEVVSEYGGTTVLNGGGGTDTASFSGVTLSYYQVDAQSITLSLALQGTVQNAGTMSVLMTGIENLQGSTVDDVLTGDAHDNVLYGNSGNDVLSGGTGSDTLLGDTVLNSDGTTANALQAGSDTLEGGAGNDLLDGGNGVDTATYDDATSGVSVSLAIAGSQAVGGGDGTDTLVSIENLTGSAYADVLAGSSVNNVLAGGSGDDTLDLSAGGNDTAQGGDGNDTIVMGAAFTANDTIDGGADSDTLTLDGDYSAGVVFKDTTLANVETIRLAAGHSYNLTTADANVASGAALTVDGSALGASDTLTLDGTHESDGTLNLVGGAGADTLSGGNGGNTLEGGLGADTLRGGGGVDAFVYTAVAESPGMVSGAVGYDVISHFDAAMDFFDLPVAVTGRDATVTAGALSTATFDSDMTTALDAAHLHAGHAVLFVPSSGTLAGDAFLVVDANGSDGYQAGADYVFQLVSSAHVASLGAGNFI
ncbi:MAG TPA: calcium-binding protein [Rhizomicrobium sp.]|jgi:Ca2+-binding RTX toxin-like protein